MHSLAPSQLAPALQAAEKLARDVRAEMGERPVTPFTLFRWAMANAPRVVALLEAHPVGLNGLIPVAMVLVRGLFEENVPRPSSPSSAPSAAEQQLFQLDPNLAVAFTATRRTDRKVLVTCRRCDWRHTATIDADVLRARSRLALGDHRRGCNGGAAR